MKIGDYLSILESFIFKSQFTDKRTQNLVENAMLEVKAHIMNQPAPQPPTLKSDI